MWNNESQNNKKEDTLGLMLIRLGVLSGVLVLSLFVFSSDVSNVQEQDIVATPAQSLESPVVSQFEYISVKAKAAYVYDLTTKEILFSKNERAQLPLASLTKLMMALVSSELISENTIVTIEESSIKVEGDNGFHIGEQWKFKNLLDYTLLVSSNDGANAIAKLAGLFINSTQSEEAKDSNARFIHQMNQTAKSLGLTQSYFINESGLDISSLVGGGYGSARDVASLLAYIISVRPSLLEATAYKTLHFISEDQFVYNATNTNAIIDTIPGLIASKTGFTDLAGGNLAIVYDAGINHPIIAVILGSSFEGRFEDMEKLVSISLAELSL